MNRSELLEKLTFLQIDRTTRAWAASPPEACNAAMSRPAADCSQKSHPAAPQFAREQFESDRPDALEKPLTGSRPRPAPQPAFQALRRLRSQSRVCFS